MEQPSDGQGQASCASGGTDERPTPAIPTPVDTLLSAIPAPVVVATADGVLVASNAAFEELTETPFPAGAALTELFPALDGDAVETNCGAETGEYVTARLPREGDDDRWVDLEFDRHRFDGEAFLVGVAHDVTTRREREQLYRQYERILETIDDGIYTLDETFTIETVNSAVTAMTGYDRSELIGSNATILADDTVLDRAARLSGELLSGERDVATLTADLETADGETVPIETRFSTYRLEDGQYRQVGVVRDISERRRFERTLAALHDTTRDLFRAQTTDEVGQLVAAAATDVFDVVGAAVYRFDSNANTLSPAAVAGAIADDPGECPAFGPGSAPLWETFLEDASATLPADEAPIPDNGSTAGVCLPVGEYGVLYAAVDADRPHPDTVEVLGLLAANAEAAFEGVNREQVLRERDEKLKAQNTRLRQLEEVNSIIRSIDQVLVEADTAAEIEQAVCDQLAGSRWFTFAWIGRVDGDKLDPSAWAGRSPGYLDAVSLSMAGEGGPPAVRTARRDSMVVVPSIADDLRSEPWRAEAVSANFQSAIAVPLRYGDVTYGSLAVYGTPEASFGEMLQTVLGELGETIANAIREVESRQRRSAPSVVELEVSLTAPNSPIRRFADAACRKVVCEGVVPGHGDTTRTFLTVEGDAAPVRDRGEELTCVESLSTIADAGEETLFEVIVSGQTVTNRLLDHVARVVTVVADSDGEAVVATVQLSTDTDVRTFLERLEGRYGDVRLLARREDVPPRNEGGIRSALEEQLTDRQLQVLRTAYLSGFFDWPRKRTGKDLAGQLDISQPTLSRHLRVGERKLLELVFDGR